MIKRIELVNFMSHEHTVIEPSDGLTVLIGPNNCGKSAIVNALQVLCTNPKSTYVLRHGAKQCKIIVETDTGDSICWSRKKSGSPKYEINGETFDRLKGKIPDRLHQVLKLPVVEADKETYDVHFGEQRSPIFLLADKEKAAAQFFASSSDAIRMVEMQTLHKAKIRRNTIDYERLKQERLELATEIAALKPIEKIKTASDQCQRMYQELQSQVATEKQMRSSTDRLTALLQSHALFVALSAVLGTVAPPPAIAATSPYLNAIERLSNLRRQSEVFSRQSMALASLQSPPAIAATEELTQTIARSSDLIQTGQRLTRSSATLEPLKQPPVLAHTKDLATTIHQLKAANVQRAHVDRAANALAAVADPPVVQPVSDLRRVIAELQAAQRGAEAIEKQVALLRGVDQPPPQTDTGPLRQMIPQLVDLNLKIEQQDQLLVQIEKDLQTTQAELANWISQHPQCPTCGGAIAIGALPCGVGSHGHTDSDINRQNDTRENLGPTESISNE